MNLTDDIRLLGLPPPFPSLGLVGTESGKGFVKFEGRRWYQTGDLVRVVNQCLKNAGLSVLHHIRKMVAVGSIPVLGTGKTDYRLLKQKLAA